MWVEPEWRDLLVELVEVWEMSGLLSLLEVGCVFWWTWIAWSCWGMPGPANTGDMRPVPVRGGAQQWWRRALVQSELQEPAARALRSTDTGGISRCGGGGTMQSRSPVRETAAGKRKTACCPCCSGGAASAWPCCPCSARECCCSWLRGMVGVPGGRGVPAADTRARTHTERGAETKGERQKQLEEKLTTG